jgi:glutathione S-transferase
MTMKLFYFPGACSLASHIVLEEVAEPYEVELVDVLSGAQHKPAYRAINPHGKVPALVTVGGVLTESPAILYYLASLRPELELLPADPFERAQAVSTLAWLSSSVHPAFGGIFQPAMMSEDEDAWPGIRAMAETRVRDHLGDLDHRLDGRIWLFDDFTVVDPYILVMRRWGSRIGLDMTEFPNLVRHGARVAARPSAERVIGREGIRIDG